MPLAPSTRLGPYEILAAIGAGGMGEVYRARDPGLNREVAIKVLPERLANDPQALARFESEAKAVAALSHPNILAIFEVGADQGVTNAVTELLEGETLRSNVKRSALPWRKAVEIGIAIADGLASAHSKGIVHRDLKPENIFLTSDGRVKILDFGLARWTAPSPSGQEAPTLTQENVIMGTAGYMSPEQIRGTCLALSKQVLPQSASGKAATYSLNMWAKLARCFEYEQVELSNNLAENSMRPVALGRKNWLHVGSVKSGPKVAAILSIVESCRRLRVPVKEYLSDVLPGMDRRTLSQVANLTPARWSAAPR